MKKHIEDALGFSLDDEQYERVKGRAISKLAGIIKQYGDCNGARREPEYLEELIYEEVISEMLSDVTLLIAGNVLNMEKEHSANCQGAPRD